MKKNLNETRKQGWLTLLALVIIAFSVSIGFSPLFELIEGGIAARVLGSSFGAIFVIVLTMFLLNKQTEIEQESKKSERVFDEKVRIYQDILEICKDMLMDGNLTQEEINRLPFPLIKLQMLADEQVIKTFQLVFEKLNKVYEVEGEIVEIRPEDKNEIYNLLSEFSSACRRDLEISSNDVDPSIQQNTVNTIAKSNKKANDQTKYYFDGKKMHKNRYVYAVITNYLNQNPSTSFKEFQENILERNFNGRTGQWEAWKTYDEVKKLHYKGSGSGRFFVTDKGKAGDILKDDDLVINLSDEKICLHKSWGLGDMKPFISLMKSKGIRVE